MLKNTVYETTRNERLNLCCLVRFRELFEMPKQPSTTMPALDQALETFHRTVLESLRNTFQAQALLRISEYNSEVSR